MLTLFTTAKPFRGHIDVIQRNALKSWKLLHPDVQVILFGDEEGADVVAAELEIQHEPYVERSHLNPRLPVATHIFNRAQEIARHPWLCYLNCDIILTPDFCEAITRLTQWRKSCLVVGRRCDLDINLPLDFDKPNWGGELRREALGHGKMRMNELDYFLFAKGMYRGMPPLIIGRVFWDYWMVWKARSMGVPVVEASPGVVVIHQNHDVAYVQETSAGQGFFFDPGAKWNYELAHDGKDFGTYEDCTHRLTRSGMLVPTFWRRQRNNSKRFLWDTFVRRTYGLRKRLGMRRRIREQTP